MKEGMMSKKTFKTIENLKLDLKSANDPDPKLDCGTCSICGWSGKLSECETDIEGNYYDGYITAVYCPVCEDGGCVDDFYPSDESLDKWELENKDA